MTKENKFSVVLVEPKQRTSDKSVLRSYAPLVVEVQLDVSGSYEDPVVSWKFKNSCIDSVKSHIEEICASYESTISISMVETEVMGNHKLMVAHRSTEGMKDAEARKQTYLPYAHWVGDTIPVHLWAAASFRSVTLKWGDKVQVKITPTEAIGLHNSLAWESSDENPYLSLEGNISDMLFAKAEKENVSITKSPDYLKGISSLKMGQIRKALKDKQEMAAVLSDPRLANLPECANVLRDILDILHQGDSLMLNDTIVEMVYGMAGECTTLVDNKGRSWSDEKVEEFIAECEQCIEYLGDENVDNRIYGFNKLITVVVKFKGEKPNKLCISDKELKIMLAHIRIDVNTKGLMQDLEDVKLDKEKLEVIKSLLTM